MMQITPIGTAWACQQRPAPRMRNGGSVRSLGTSADHGP